jgi:hypothetical protein
MDEKGCAMGTADSIKVLISTSKGEAMIAELGNHDWMSVIECILSGVNLINSISLSAFIIFSGQRMQHSWITPDLDKETVIQVSPSG